MTLYYMNHVIHHIETPPGQTPPRLLAGGREGKVLYAINEPHDYFFQQQVSFSLFSNKKEVYFLLVSSKQDSLFLVSKNIRILFFILQ